MALGTACSQGEKVAGNNPGPAPVQSEGAGSGVAGMRKEDSALNERGQTVQKAKGSGKWFPGGKKQLESMVNEYIQDAKVAKIEGRIVGAIAPHAGYIFSGKVAGYTFRAIRDNAAAGFAPDTVVVLGFSHRGAFRGVALMEGDGIETPMGVAALDKEAGELLVKPSGGKIYFNYSLHGSEHSAENEIPFIQAALPKAKLVVGLIGSHDAETVDALVAALKELAKQRKVLAVASTDLLHDPDYDLVTKKDKATLEKIAAMNHAGLAREWDYSNQVCCGIGPVLAVMKFAEAQAAKKGLVLHYRNSGDDHPDSRGNWVVGYGAVVFVGE
jgi:hypothetical protein